MARQQHGGGLADNHLEGERRQRKYRWAMKHASEHTHAGVEFIYTLKGRLHIHIARQG